MDSDNFLPSIDAEKGTCKHFGKGNGHVGSRIAPVLPHLGGYDFGESDSGSEILGKQIELEAGHALQYRTCSWQKVDSPYNYKNLMSSCKSIADLFG